MKIAIVTYMYPGEHNSSDFVFVKLLVDEFARYGHECVVCCPFNCLHYRRLHKGVEVYSVDDNSITVFRPNYLSTSSFHIGSFSMSSWLHNRAVVKTLNMMKRHDFNPDVIYCHFWSSGFEAFPFAQKNNIPLFIASGESDIMAVSSPDLSRKDFIEYVSGVICVSSKNQEESIRLGLSTKEKCMIAPNAIDDNLFIKKDKAECRKKLGFPQDVFIVAFVGWFNERKGSKRVSEAIKKLSGNDIYSIFVGSGTEVPDCPNILYKGKLPHEELPSYLNAADVFVLPTQKEGCCNSIVEAMACGLPIISSNRSFNFDVLDESNSILVEPDSIEEIAEAIITLKNDSSKREFLSKGSLQKARELTLSNRAKKILDFIAARK